jgi:hypothetical protein
MRSKKTSSKSTSSYHVGKGRPPLATRWKPGQSGNPRGRPHGSKNLGTMLMEELNEKVKIQRNGGTKSVTKRQVIVKRLVNNAVNGDWKATNLVLDHDREPSPDFGATKKINEEGVNIGNLTREERQKRAADAYFKYILEPRQKPMPR